MIIFLTYFYFRLQFYLIMFLLHRHFPPVTASLSCKFFYKSIKKSYRPSKLVPDFKHRDFISFDNSINSFNWSYIIDTSVSPFIAWSSFISILQQGISFFVPPKRSRYTSYRKLFIYPYYIRSLLRTKKQLWHTRCSICRQNRYKTLACKC